MCSSDLRQGTADSAYMDWQYLNGTKTAPGTGFTSASLRFPKPTTGGTFEFRLFENNGFNRLVTSETVTVP